MQARESHRLLQGLTRRLRQVLTRGLVRLIDSATLMQTLQVELQTGEVLDGVEHFEAYGLTAVAPSDGREVIAGSVAGRRSHTIGLVVANRLVRLQGLAEGEVALYDDLGNVFKLGREQVSLTAVQHVNVTAPSIEVTATTVTITATSTHNGDVTINGNLAVSGNTNVGGIATVTGNTVVGGALAVTGTGAFGGALTSTTSIADAAGTMATVRSVFNSHTHPESGGGTTSAPNQTM